MEWRLELVVVPVADVDRAKAFYLDQVGFNLLVDHRAGDFRVLQLTPPGSACSIALMRDPEGAGSLQGLHLIAPDTAGARAELISRAVETTDLFHYVNGQQVPGPDPDRSDYNTFSFSYPEGAGWMVQEVNVRPEPG
jgi:catechol 2,3-dioxygenase-like lactoylglutathione lyase family enzyme